MFTFIAGDEVKVLTMDTYIAWLDSRSDDVKPYCSPLAFANENFLYETDAYKANRSGIWETIIDTKDRVTVGPRVAVYRWVDKKPLPQHVELLDASTMTAEEIYNALDEMGE